MQKVNLYRYEINGVILITPNKHNETDVPSQMRLIADENCILTNDTIETPVVDVMLDEVSLWDEVSETTVISDIEQKAQAYDILMGVDE